MIVHPVGPLDAVVLGLVEGLTEYLPVSSTGHLILAGQLLAVDAKSFEIVIQLGAILAVVVHYRKLLAERLAGLFRGEAIAVRLAVALGLAFVPAAVVGLAFRKAIKAHLFAPLPVAGALIVGGVVMIAVDFWKRQQPPGDRGLDKITPLRALVIGLGQCLSLWPGSSRSMCTIVTGQLLGLSTETAAEFSFLLALPTLGAATVYEGWKSRHELMADGGAVPLVIGLVVSFVVAWVVIGAFLKFLQRHGLAVFGYYRMVLGAVVLWLWR